MGGDGVVNGKINFFSYLSVHSNEETDFPLLTVFLAKKNAKLPGNFTILVGFSFTLLKTISLHITKVKNIILNFTDI